jgi:hypothetical protein
MRLDPRDDFRCQQPNLRRQPALAAQTLEGQGCRCRTEFTLEEGKQRQPARLETGSGGCFAVSARRAVQARPSRPCPSSAAASASPFAPITGCSLLHSAITSGIRAVAASDATRIACSTMRALARP